MYIKLIYDKNINGDIMFFSLLYKALLFYFLLALIIRFLGKREVGKINVFDFVILLLIADIASIAIENKDINYFYIVLVLISLALLQKLVSFVNLKFYKIRNIIDGKPAVLVINGEIQFDQLKKNLYSIEDLLIEMRSSEIKSIKDILIAVLEINGKLSIFERNNQNKDIPLPVIISGNIVIDNLKYLNITKNEIEIMLKEKGYQEKDILYGQLINKDLFLIEKK
jgi:uncharacterized membrane protein YcaP (DUF421 family)